MAALQNITDHVCFKQLVSNKELLLDVSRQSPRGIVDVASVFHSHREELIQMATNDVEFFKKAVSSFKLLTDLTAAFSQHRQAIATILFGNADYFQAILSSSDNLATLVKIFPERRYTILESVLTNPGIFAKMTSSVHNVYTLARTLPSITKDIISCKEKIIQTLLANPTHFKNIIHSGSDVADLAYIFPRYREGIIQLILADPLYFQKIIFHPNDVGALVAACPHYEAKIRFLYRMQNAPIVKNLKAAIDRRDALFINKISSYLKARLVDLNRGGVKTDKIDVPLVKSLVQVVKRYFDHPGKPSPFHENMEVLRKFLNELQLSSLQSTVLRYIRSQLFFHHGQGREQVKGLPIELQGRLRVRPANINAGPL